MKSNLKCFFEFCNSLKVLLSFSVSLMIGGLFLMLFCPSFMLYSAFFFFGFLIVMIYAFVKYPKNYLVNILFWFSIIFIFCYIIFLILSFLSLNDAFQILN